MRTKTDRKKRLCAGNGFTSLLESPIIVKTNWRYELGEIVDQCSEFPKSMWAWQNLQPDPLYELEELSGLYGNGSKLLTKEITSFGNKIVESGCGQPVNTQSAGSRCIAKSFQRTGS